MSVFRLGHDPQDIESALVADAIYGIGRTVFCELRQLDDTAAAGAMRLLTDKQLGALQIYAGRVGDDYLAWAAVYEEGRREGYTEARRATRRARLLLWLRVEG